MRAAVGAAAVIAAVLAVTGCTAPSDDDGEAVGSGVLAAAPAKLTSAVPVVVDSDLGADDLVALAYLLRHPGVQVRAVTVAATGLGRCPASVDVAGDLFTALAVEPVPVACGRDRRGPTGRPFPIAWQMAALTGSGLPRDPGSLDASAVSAPELISRLAATTDGLHVVALGPLSNVADAAAQAPSDYRRLAGVHAMAGVVEGDGQEGVGEWNAAADPEALAAVLAGPVPVTVVPADAVPEGTPEPLRAPVVGHVVSATRVPAWWDLAAAAAFATPQAVESLDGGGWDLSGTQPGRLRPDGDADGDGVRVVRRLDASRLEASYAEVFRSGA